MELAEKGVSQLANSQYQLWNDCERAAPTEQQLASIAVALGAEDIKALSVPEVALLRSLPNLSPVNQSRLSILRDLIVSGFDPLGEAFCSMRTAENRRIDGAIYTPRPIVQSMVDWAVTRGIPGRVIEPGAGSARFLMTAARAFPAANLIGVESDPLAALLARANLAVAGCASRARIIVADYRLFTEAEPSPTLYIGNPPYVRHHHIAPRWKIWLADEAENLGYKASKLAGLHVHFFLATARNARPGDFGAFITSAEWLDVNYGSLVRSLIIRELGGQSVTVIDPTVQPFPDVATTAAITTFNIGTQPKSVSFKRINSVDALGGFHKGMRVHRDRLSSHVRWSCLTRTALKSPEGYVELGEFCRVHRGQVTGSNGVWIAGKHSGGLPRSVMYPAITRAREVFAADGVLDDTSRLRCVIDLPVDLDELDRDVRDLVDIFLKRAKALGADRGYIARHRKAWWAVGLREPAPIISTYMARRPPAFLLNKADARHINIAHGLYPRIPLSAMAQTTLVRFMQTSVSQCFGRTYAGGLTKFEPREMERLIVPGPHMLSIGAIQ